MGDELEEEPSGVSPEDRELAARPKEAGFYKKELNTWDVAQKLFKQEMDDYDKEQQQKKGVQHSIKYRTAHAREWFNNMTSAHRKEVEEARDKWNREGASAEAQAMYIAFFVFSISTITTLAGIERKASKKFSTILQNRCGALWVAES